MTFERQKKLVQLDPIEERSLKISHPILQPNLRNMHYEKRVVRCKSNNTTVGSMKNVLIICS